MHHQYTLSTDRNLKYLCQGIKDSAKDAARPPRYRKVVVKKKIDINNFKGGILYSHVHHYNWRLKGVIFYSGRERPALWRYHLQDTYVKDAERKREEWTNQQLTDEAIWLLVNFFFRTLLHHNFFFQVLLHHKARSLSTDEHKENKEVATSPQNCHLPSCLRCHECLTGVSVGWWCDRVGCILCTITSW